MQAVARVPPRRVLAVAALATLTAALVMDLAVAPPDALQGQSQRLMYLHVPAAIGAYLSFAVAVICGLVYLSRRERSYDRAARAAVEIGVGLTGLTLVEGSIWARPTWGVYWTWDPRLVATAVLFLVYLGYLALRTLPGDRHVAARRAALFSLVGFAMVPVDHYSVSWFPSVHQPPALIVEDPRMLAALALSMVGFFLLAVCIYLRRLDVLAARDAAVATGSVALETPAGEPAVVHK